MNISELKIGQGNVDVEADVKEIDETRTFNKFGRQVSVANAVIADDSGSVKLTLWNEDIQKVKVGDKVKITNGYVNEFNGEKQLTSGKFGQLEVVGEGSEAPAEEPKEEEKEEEPAEEPAEE